MVTNLKGWLIGVVVLYLGVFLFGGAIDLYEAFLCECPTKELSKELFISYLFEPKYILMCLIGGLFVGKSIEVGRNRNRDSNERVK